MDSGVVQFVIGEEQPEVIIIATGSLPIDDGMQMITFQPVPGWICPTSELLMSVFISGESLSGKIVVADSTTYIEGPGISEFLVRKGAAKVTLVTPHPHISPELSLYNQLVHVVRRLSASGVEVVPFSWLRKIEEGKVLVYNIATGEEQRLEVDYVVLNTGRRQSTGLAEIFKKSVPEVFEIGDCNIAGGRIGGAIESGYALASKL